MSQRQRVSVAVRRDPPADACERIIEVSFASGRSCLISVRAYADGDDVVEVYRADPGISVLCDALDHPVVTGSGDKP